MTSPTALQEPDIEREHPCAPKATIHALPIELMLHIFPLLPLQSLISARGVSQQWRQLVSVSIVLPARRSLLDFYLEVVNSPSFLKSRDLLLPELRDVDRREYVSAIENETGVDLPQEFRMWVLEWPTRAVATWLWPGLGSVQPNPLLDILPRQTMNLLKSFGMRPRKIHLRHRSTCDDTVVLRPMRLAEAVDTAQDSCWMIIVQVSRDPFALDFLLFGGNGLGADVNDTVLMVKDDVVRPGMSWVEYLRKEVQKQDEAYLTRIGATAPSDPPPPLTRSRTFATPASQSAVRKIHFGVKLRRYLSLDSVQHGWQRVSSRFSLPWRRS